MDIKTILFYFAILIYIFSVANLLLNSRFKYWEIITILPTTIITPAVILLSVISFFIEPFIALILIISLINIFPFTDFTFFKIKTRSSIGTKLKIIDSNTLYFYPDNREELANYFIAKDPDILVLQEIYDVKGEEKIKLVRKQSIFETVLPDGYISNERLKELFLNYKYILQNQDRALISKYETEIYKTYETNEVFGYTIFKVNLGKTFIYMVNVHLPFKKNLIFGYDLRKQAFNNLISDLEELKNQNVIITGDFNTAKTSGFIRKLFNNYNEGISESNVGLHLSWHTHVPFLMLWRMDFLFYKKNNVVNCVDAKVLKNKYSDHKEINAEFVIAE